MQFHKLIERLRPLQFKIQSVVTFPKQWNPIPDDDRRDGDDELIHQPFLDERVQQFPSTNDPDILAVSSFLFVYKRPDITIPVAHMFRIFPL